MVLRCTDLEIKLGLFFSWTSTQIIYKWQNITLINTWTIYLLKSSTHLEPSIFYIWESFAIWGNGATIMHLPHGSTPTNTCPTKYSNARCLRLVCVWVSYKNLDQLGIMCTHGTTKHMFRICCPWTLTCFSYIVKGVGSILYKMPFRDHVALQWAWTKYSTNFVIRYTKYDIWYLITFNVVTTLTCSTLIFNSLTISVRHKCVAIFPTATFFLWSMDFIGLVILGMAPHLLARWSLICQSRRHCFFISVLTLHSNM